MLGKFKARTRTTVAHREALAALRLLGIAEDVDYVLGASTTSTVVKIKMKSWAAVTRAVAKFREAQLESDYAEEAGRLWALRGRSPGEIARTGPVARAHRRIRELLEEWRLQNWVPAWEVEASYKHGLEGLCITWDGWANEFSLLKRAKEGVWKINEELFTALVLPGTAQVFLAECLWNRSAGRRRQRLHRPRLPPESSVIRGLLKRRR